MLCLGGSSELKLSVAETAEICSTASPNVISPGVTASPVSLDKYWTDRGGCVGAECLMSGHISNLFFPDNEKEKR